jgi:hypothetical protein
MPRIKLVTQLQLQGFADVTREADDDNTPLAADEIKRRSMASKLALEVRAEAKEGEIVADVPEWFEQYHRLINAGMKWRIAAYIAWATMPRHLRMPKTQEELARNVLGLTSDRVIAEWRKNYPIDQLIADLQAEALLGYRPGAFHALGTMATQLSYRAAPDRKLFFEMTQDYTPRQRVIETDGNAAIEDFSALSDAELEAMSGETAKSMIKRLRAEMNADDADGSDDTDKADAAQAGAE